MKAMYIGLAGSALTLSIAYPLSFREDFGFLILKWNADVFDVVISNRVVRIIANLMYSLVGANIWITVIKWSSVILQIQIIGGIIQMWLGVLGLMVPGMESQLYYRSLNILVGTYNEIFGNIFFGAKLSLILVTSIGFATVVIQKFELMILALCILSGCSVYVLLDIFQEGVLIYKMSLKCIRLWKHEDSFRKLEKFERVKFNFRLHRRTLRSLRTIRIKSGSLYYLDRGITLLIFHSVINYTINAILLFNGLWK